MLRSLYIRDYALIEELEVAFEGGLNIITGETGAGKSILIGALKMILGERASTEVVRQGAKKAIIEGVFDEADTPALRALLEANEIEPAESIILRREISGSASRAFINDSPATAQLLRDVAAQLIDLHGQHEHQSLLHPDTHIVMLDSFGLLGPLVDEYRTQYTVVQDLVREHKALVARERELRRQKELYEFQIGEIDRTAPQPGEEEELEAESRVLENAEVLFEATAKLSQMLYESDQAITDQLAVARNELQDLARIDASFEGQLEEVKSALIVITEVAKALQGYNSRIEFNPERLEEVRQRLSAFEMLKRKYGATIEAVLEYRKEIGETYELAVDFEGAIQRSSERIAAAQKELSTIALRLSERRREVAVTIEKAIVEELSGLGIAHSQFEVRFDRHPDASGWITLDNARYEAFPTGVDDVEFYITTNLGEPPRPLARVASGGEISRVMLALKSILAKSERMPILVFDEIDVGISGVIARKVGEAMHALGRFHQIIAITHHAQIAALGDAHYLVAKRVEGDRTRTQIRRLETDERTTHIAALISGDKVTEAALESARELMLAGSRAN